MKIEYLGFVPTIILLFFIVKEAIEDWRYSFLKMLLFYIIPASIATFSVIYGLLIALRAL